MPRLQHVAPYDGRKHYGLMRFAADGSWSLAVDYTGTAYDHLRSAVKAAARRSKTARRGTYYVAWRLS